MNDSIPAPEADLLPTPEAAALIGVPDAEFTRLAEVLNLKAARPGTTTTPRMWDRALIEQLRDGPEGEEIRQTANRKEQIKVAFVRLEEKYPRYRAALKDAAAAMFQFNRWIKHATCSRLRMRELYDLKNLFIELLYTLGLCKEVLEHRIVLEDEEDESGEGITQVREFVCFLFDIDGQEFEWHQPRRSLTFEYTVTAPLPDAPPRAEWKPRAGPKRVTLTPEEFFEAETLIRFVLKKRKDEKEQERRAASQARREQMRAEGLARQAELRRQREADSEGTP
jgi:hypothetical protein